MAARIIVIGASSGGIDALSRLAAGLPRDFPVPILICQHVAAHGPGLLPQILSSAGPLKAVHPTSPQLLAPGVIYVAPPDRHLLVEDGYAKLSHGPHENLARPAVDPLFRSAALAYGPGVVGVVLTGQLDDGTAGLLAIKDAGGVSIVQDPSEATAPSMPRSALRHVRVDHRCKLSEMAKLITELARDPPGAGELNPKDLALMQTETRIAGGAFDLQDWENIQRTSEPTGLNCPACRSALYELHDDRLLRFRCRSGHAFSALSLLSGQAEARENLLSSIFGALIEEATVAKRLLGMPDFAVELHIGGGLTQRVDEIENESVQVSSWLHAMSGWVEPEPT